MTLVKLILGALKMNPADLKKNAKANDDALVAFVASKAEIDAIVTRIQTFSDKHFEVAPDEVTWGDVGAVGHRCRAGQADH
jgi:hypothetical protein